MCQNTQNMHACNNKRRVHITLKYCIYLPTSITKKRHV